MTSPLVWARVRLVPPVLRRVLRVRAVDGLVRLGSAYGGWVVPEHALRAGAVCYSAGLGEDATFDLALAVRGCEVHVFDPTPRAIAYAATVFAGVVGIEFHAMGLWSGREVRRFYAPADPAHVSHSTVNLRNTSAFFEAPCESVSGIMKQLGHATIDLLKLDIEGAEYEVLQSMLAAGVRPAVVCAEFDQAVPLRRTVAQVRALQAAGYALTALDGWNYTFCLTS